MAQIVWDLGISDLQISWIKQCLESTSYHPLSEKWSGLCRSADTSKLYLLKKNGGLSLPNITTLYKKIKVSNACQLLLSQDPTCQHVCKSKVLKEEAQKRAVFKLMLTAQDIVARDNGAQRNSIMKRKKSCSE